LQKKLTESEMALNFRNMERIKIFFLLFVFSFAGEKVIGQTFTDTELKALQAKEDTLKQYAFNIINSKDVATRFRSDSNFTRILVRTLQLKNSFYYPLAALCGQR